MQDPRGLATRFTSLAILLVGIAFLSGSIALLRGGTGGSIFLGALLGLLGLAVAVGALLFLLVPHRVDDLREMEREYTEEHGPYEPR